MPGENLQKLNKEELTELRKIIRKIYFKDSTPEELKIVATDRECDKLIDSLLPSTIDECRKVGLAKSFIRKKKFFIASKILDVNGRAILKNV